MGRSRKNRGLSTACAVLAALVALAVAGCGGGSDNTKTTKATASCDSKGINNSVGNVGTCLRDGITYTVVNKNQVLHLEELDAQLTKLQSEKSVQSSPTRKAIAKGRFVVVTLRLKNKTDSDQRFGGPGFEQSVLAIGNRQFPEGASATTLLRSSFLGTGLIKKGKTVTGSMAFEVPTKLAEDLVGKKAVLAITNFNDGGRIDLTNRLGIIRLWK